MPKFAAGFFAGMCRLEDRPLTFRDPPHSSIRELTRPSLGPPRWSTSRVERILSLVVTTLQQFMSVNTSVEGHRKGALGLTIKLVN
jgi:hypothetical protein